MNGVRPLALLVALWMLASGGAAAQVPTGAVAGVLRSDGDGAPLPLALVQLQSDGSAAAVVRPVLTDDEGRFRFDNVPPGVYRLRVVRVGYATVVSAGLQIRSGETLRHDLRSSAAPIQLAELRVGPSRCLQAGQLAEVPAVATLWNEARKGREVRSVFILQYSYVWIQNYVTHHRAAGGGTRTTTRTDTLLSDTIPAWEARRRARLAGGFGSRRGPVLHSVSEVDILNDEFLRTHCLEGTVEESEGMLGLRFRPVQNRRGFVDISGVVWVDADDFLMRRLDFEYLDGGRPLAGASYTYEDFPVGDGVFRLVRRGEVTGRGKLELRVDATNNLEQIRRVVP